MSQAAIITANHAEAFIASAWRVLTWLLGVVLRLGASGRSAQLKRALSWAECGVERILFLKALALYGPLPRRRHHPRGAPAGFRRATSKASAFFRSAGIRARKASALTRVLALISALSRPQRAVAYFLKQISKGLRLNRLVAVAPPAAIATSASPFTAEAVFTDTS